MAWQVENQSVAELIETFSDPAVYRWRDRVIAAQRLADEPLNDQERAAATSAALLVLEDVYYWNPAGPAKRVIRSARDIFFLCSAFGLVYGIGRLDPYHNRSALYILP